MQEPAKSGRDIAVTEHNRRRPLEAKPPLNQPVQLVTCSTGKPVTSPFGGVRGASMSRLRRPGDRFTELPVAAVT